MARFYPHYEERRERAKALVEGINNLLNAHYKKIEAKDKTDFPELIADIHKSGTAPLDNIANIMELINGRAERYDCKLGTLDKNEIKRLTYEINKIISINSIFKDIKNYKVIKVLFQKNITIGKHVKYSPSEVFSNFSNTLIDTGKLLHDLERHHPEMLTDSDRSPFTKPLSFIGATISDSMKAKLKIAHQSIGFVHQYAYNIQDNARRFDGLLKIMESLVSR